MANKTNRNFGLSTLSLRNSISVFILSALLILFGVFSYITMPKESFPEIVFPLIYVQTPYPGNTPVDIENLITRPLEKEIKSVSGIKNLNSESVQDVSIINVEFNIDVDTEKALQDVKDAVDRAMGDLPSDLDQDPVVLDIDLSRVPILNINLSGDYSIDDLVDYTEYLQDEIEELSEISEATITGDKEKEVQVNIDLPKLQANQLSFNDVQSALASENINIGAGDILLGKTRRSIRTDAEFTNMDEIRNVIVKHENGNIVYLKDIADVLFTYKEVESFARLGGESVVSLNVIKKSGENLLDATDKIRALIAKAKKDVLPEGLRITITNDQSKQTRNQLANLENSIISGVILVVITLLFFLGLRNATFVGLSIPFSMFISFLVLSALGVSLNFIVLFSLILALGMLVDNAIVTIENIYRLYADEGYSAFEAARQGVGEVAVPIISSTATTLAAFFPLLFWDDIIGEFMGYLPRTLIIVLGSSLFVALVINPVIASVFMKKQDLEKKVNNKKAIIWTAVFAVLGVLLLVGDNTISGNLMLTIAGGVLLFSYILTPLSAWFQKVLLPRLERVYARSLKYSLSGIRPFLIILGTVVLMFVSIGFYFSSNPKVEFFPVNEPNYINVFVEVPLGTDVIATDSVAQRVEKRLNEVLAPYSDIVESIVTNVGAETASQNEFGGGGGNNTPNKARITVSFVEYEFRNEVRTTDVQRKVTEELNNWLPGVTVSVEKENNGPPVGRDISLELTGNDFEVLLASAEEVKKKIDRAGIEGIENLQIDLETNKPELLVKINRDHARRLGVSTQQVALALRTALFGSEASKYKEGEDDYPIEVRLKREYRYDVASLMNQPVTFRSQASGRIVQVPISAVASYEFNSSYNSIKRKDSERLVTVYSNVVEGFNKTEINNSIKDILKDQELPQGYNLKFGGSQEEQAESSAFLVNALLIAISLITIILVSQFNSASKPFIIILTVLFSTIGVFLGLGIFQMEFVVIMTGIGIVSLAGIVVNNGIVLIDFIELSRNRIREKLGLEDNEELNDSDLVEAIELGGMTRLRPVLLTAITTVLGLLPLAVGLNIDFIGLLDNRGANIYFGGDNAIFWSPMAWTVIFGLVFATFLTLIVVPVMYLLLERLNRWLRKVVKFA